MCLHIGFDLNKAINRTISLYKSVFSPVCSHRSWSSAILVLSNIWSIIICQWLNLAKPTFKMFCFTWCAQCHHITIGLQLLRDLYKIYTKNIMALFFFNIFIGEKEWNFIITQLKYPLICARKTGCASDSQLFFPHASWTVQDQRIKV